MQIVLVPSRLERGRLGVLDEIEAAWREAAVSPRSLSAPGDARHASEAGAPGVRVVVCGVGVVAAALTAAELLSEERRAGRVVERCWLVGLAGTRDPERAPPGTLVWPDAARNEAIGAGWGAAFVDLAAMGLGPAEEEVIALAPPSPEERELLAHAMRAATATAAEPRGGLVIGGAVGTVAAASPDAAAASGWRERHPDVLVEDMESWSVALVLRRAGVPLTVLRAVSNVAGDRHVAGWALDDAFASLDRALAGLLLGRAGGDRADGSGVRPRAGRAAR